MTGQRIFIPLAALVVGLAGLMGVLTASTAQASTVYATVWVNPGGNHDRLLCGWHGHCKSSGPSTGEGLDFRNYDTDEVIFRSFGARLTGSGNIGTGEAIQSDTGCYRVRVHIEGGTGAFVFSALYTHTDTAKGGVFNIAGGTLSSPTLTTKAVGDTVVTDKVGCAYEGAHLHQSAEDYATRNISGYPTHVNARDNDADDLTKWIHTEAFNFVE